MKALAAILAAIEFGTIVSDDVLEPSVRNEVDHALARAAEVGRATEKSTAVASTASVPSAWTNGLSATAIALKFVSSQRADGHWFDGTNDVTGSVVQVLEKL